jgi:hypothetical protein
VVGLAEWRVGKGLTEERFKNGGELGSDLVAGDEGGYSPGVDGSFVDLPVDAFDGDGGDLRASWSGTARERVFRIIRGEKAQERR